jgi:hypothetical protein
MDYEATAKMVRQQTDGKAVGIYVLGQTSETSGFTLAIDPGEDEVEMLDGIMQLLEASLKKLADMIREKRFFPGGEVPRA